eukprot:10405857-Lingulodinium_polyedra.AAC.1
MARWLGPSQRARRSAGASSLKNSSQRDARSTTQPPTRARGCPSRRLENAVREDHRRRRVGGLRGR